MKEEDNNTDDLDLDPPSIDDIINGSSRLVGIVMGRVWAFGRVIPIDFGRRNAMSVYTTPFSFHSSFLAAARSRCRKGIEISTAPYELYSAIVIGFSHLSAAIHNYIVR